VRSSAFPPVLEVRGLSKSFGPVRALRNVDLAVEAGTIHALVGLNGSGKSTLIKCLSGYYRPDVGSITVRGTPLDAGPTLRIRQHAGLAFMHQDLGLVPDMPIVDNVRAGPYGTRWGRITWRSERAAVKAALRRFGVDRDVDDDVSVLAPWERAIVGLVRALQTVENRDEPGVVVLDEPTVSLPDHEVALLFSAVRDVAEAGSGVLFVSHRTEEVLALSQELSVLRDGEMVGTWETASLDSRNLVKLIVGRELGHLYPSGESRTGDRLLLVDQLHGPSVHGASFSVSAGEIVGLAGIVGAGHEKVPHLLFGSIPRAKGSVQFSGRELTKLSPRNCIAAGMAFVPGDRGGQSALLQATTRENITATNVSRYRRTGRLRTGAERVCVAKLIEEYNVVPADPETLFSGLSGGNQQKVIIARVLQNDPKLLMLDEPTQGVDVSAKQHIFQMIKKLASEGVAVIYASVEYEDLAHVCDRVLIFRGGRIAAELVKDELTKERVLEQCYLDC